MTTTPRRYTEAERIEADRNDRRQFWIVVGILTFIIVALTGFYVVTNELIDPPTPAGGALQQQSQPALDVPDGGHKPVDSGDRGGSQQLALMVGLTVVIIGGAAYVVHSSRRARRKMFDEHVEDAPTA